MWLALPRFTLTARCVYLLKKVRLPAKASTEEVRAWSTWPGLVVNPYALHADRHGQSSGMSA